MAIPPTIQKIDPADFKDAPAWFTGRFLNTLNTSFLRYVYNALNQALTFIQNFNAFYNTSTVQGAASAAGNAYKFAIPTTFQGNPVEVVVAQCMVAGAPESAIGGAVAVSWYASAGVVYIKEVFGLTAGTSYDLTVRVS